MNGLEDGLFQIMWDKAPALTSIILLVIVLGWIIHNLQVLKLNLKHTTEKVEALSLKVDKLSDKLDRLIEMMLSRGRQD